jgi:hypothetical protein
MGQNVVWMDLNDYSSDFTIILVQFGTRGQLADWDKPCLAELVSVFSPNLHTFSTGIPLTRFIISLNCSRGGKAAMQTKQRKISQIKMNLLVDIAIFTAFLIALDPHMTGTAIHEWLGIALSAAIIAHLLLHWKWLVQITRRFLKRLPGQSRLNYLVNALLFIDVTLIILSGLMISEEALPLLGIAIQRDSFWRMLHTLSADWAIYILGLHVALHWKWIASAIKRYVLRPIGRAFRPAQAIVIPVRADQESK